MKVEDYEKQEDLRKSNQLFSERNNLQRRQLEHQGKQSFQMRQVHNDGIL
ncbi:hypothetical protein [Streptococcus parauberis]|nr:hypothetical protein [Streptococcus parauberis]PIA86450.1 hypothetical protein ADO07_00121 [Streptococcus parauberis]